MGSKKKTTGYWYKLMIHFGWCHGPIDSLLEIRGGDRVAWSGDQTGSGRITINAPNLWGGKSAEGGIDGDFDVMFGEAGQMPNDYLLGQQGQPQSAYRGIASGVFRGGRVGANNPYPKPWAFKLRRVLAGWDGDPWYPERAQIWLVPPRTEAWLPEVKICAMNPAHIIYQTLTDRVRGQGEPRGMIDDASFRAVADLLYTEKLGLCATYRGASASDLEAFQQQIINIIGGVLQQDRTTGLWRLDLIRGDEAIDEMIVIGPDDIISIDVEPSEPSEAVNQILVEWFDPIDKMDRTTAPIQSLGNIQSTGGVSSETLTMREIPTEDLALRIGARELHDRCIPTVKITLKLNRRGNQLRGGRAFRLQCPDAGIADMVCIAGEIRRGSLLDGTVQVIAVQSTTRMPDTVYITPPGSLWQPPSFTPIPSPYRAVIEAPYYELAAIYPLGVDQMPAEIGYVMTFGAQPSRDMLDYVLATAGAGEAYEERDGIMRWTPTAVLAAGADRTTTQFTLQDESNLASVEVGTAVLLDDEILRVDAIDAAAGTAALARGCADTVPAAHAAGARLWFIGDDYGADEREYQNNEMVGVKMLTRSFTQQLAIDAAPVNTVTMQSRAHRPYPPGNFAIDGQRYPDAVAGDVAVTWSHRDRVLQADQLLDTMAGNVGPEPGTLYMLEIFGNGTRVRSEETTETSFVYTAALEAEDGGPFDTIRVRLWSVRDGVASLQMHDHTISRT